MAKGPIVTTKVEVLIASVYQKHPKWQAKDVHKEVSLILRKSNPKLPPGWPGLSTVQKVLATVRKNMKETPLDPQDKPWSMGTLNEYPIPPDAIPSVLKVWKFREEQTYKFNFEGVEVPEYDRKSLTIRQAKWVGRLSHVTMPGETGYLSTGYLTMMATDYAETEQANELAGNPGTYNTHAADAFITGLEWPYHKDEESIQEQYKGYLEMLVKEETKKKGAQNERLNKAKR